MIETIDQSNLINEMPLSKRRIKMLVIKKSGTDKHKSISKGVRINLSDNDDLTVSLKK